MMFSYTFSLIYIVKTLNGNVLVLIFQQVQYMQATNKRICYDFSKLSGPINTNIMDQNKYQFPLQMLEHLKHTFTVAQVLLIPTYLVHGASFHLIGSGLMAGSYSVRDSTDSILFIGDMLANIVDVECIY